MKYLICLAFFLLYVCALSLSNVQLFESPWTVAYWTPLSPGFPRQNYGSGLPFLSPGDLPDPETEPVSPALAGGLFTTEPPGKPFFALYLCSNVSYC